MGGMCVVCGLPARYRKTMINGAANIGDNMKHIKKIIIIMMAGTILCSGQPLTVHAAAMASQSGQTAQSDDNSLSSLSLSSGQSEYLILITLF